MMEQVGVSSWELYTRRESNVSIGLLRRVIVSANTSFFVLFTVILKPCSGLHQLSVSSIVRLGVKCSLKHTLNLLLSCNRFL